jgi:hypothetical protein
MKNCSPKVSNDSFVAFSDGIIRNLFPRVSPSAAP